MASSENTKAVQKATEVTFSVELRLVTPAQADAGKRLFKRLITKAQLKGGGDGRG
jgi:hypothetical protein